MNSYESFGIEGVKLGGSGNQYVKCPKCSHERKKKHVKSLSVNVDTGQWLCHHCNETGGVANGWKGEENPNKPMIEQKSKMIVVPQVKRQTNLSDKQIDWFRKRMISVSTLERNKVSMEVTWMPQTGKDETCIAFNYFRNNQVVNVKYRDGRKNFRQVKDADKILYGLDDIVQSNEDFMVWSEGEMDKLSWEEVGIKNAVSVPDGAPNPNAKNLENKFTYLENCADEIEKVKKHYIAVDNDAAGEMLKEELCRRLGRHRCWIVKYPDGCKDANDVLVEYGGDVLGECFKSAEPYPIEDVIMVQDFADAIDKLYATGYDTGEKVGFGFSHSDKMKAFDDLISFKTGMFMAVTGVPTHGKSNFVEQLIMLLNKNAGWKAGIFSPEHYPMEIMFSRVAKMHVGKPFFKGKDSRMSMKELQIAKEYYNDNYFFIRPKDERFDLDTVLDATAGLVLRHGIKIVVIDPWNTITHDKAGKTDTDYTEAALNKINDFKQKYDVLVIVIAHPTKQKKLDNGEFERPSLYSISGSSHWYNKCDYGLVVYRDFKAMEVQAYVEKVKFEHLGQVGMALFKWNHLNSRYYPKGSEPYNKMYGVDEVQTMVSLDPEPNTDVFTEQIPDDEVPF